MRKRVHAFLIHERVSEFEITVTIDVNGRWYRTRRLFCDTRGTEALPRASKLPETRGSVADVTGAKVVRWVRLDDPLDDHETRLEG